MNNKYDSLIFGKNQLERIVSIEVNENQLEIFCRESDGKLNIIFLPNKYWILSSKPLKNKWARLRGDLHYKWGQQYNTRHEYFMAKNYYKNEDIFSINDAKEASMVKDGFTYFKGMDFKDPWILSFDIETTGLEHNADSKVLLISNTFRRNGVMERRLFSYDDYETDAEMFDDWCSWVRKKDPDIIIGHNIYGFDLNYMYFCADRAGTSLKLGRDGSDLKFNNYESKFRKDGSQFLHYKKVKIYGRELVDTMFLAIKYDVGRKYESYGLKPIIAHEGLEVKDRQFYDASKIRFNYKKPDEWKKIKAYAEHDADDSLALYDLMSAPWFYMAQSVAKPYQMIHESATGAQINSMMIRAYLQNAHSLPKADESAAYEGAVSFGVPGIYRNLLKIDFHAMYPSIIRQFRVHDEKKDPNAYFLKMVEYFTSKRSEYKKLYKETKNSYYDDLQMATKTLANSMYGVLGASGLLFNSPTNAAFITKKGRELLDTSIIWATGRNTESWIEEFKEKTK